MRSRLGRARLGPTLVTHSVWPRGVILMLVWISVRRTLWGAFAMLVTRRRSGGVMSSLRLRHTITSAVLAHHALAHHALAHHALIHVILAHHRSVMSLFPMAHLI